MKKKIDDKKQLTDGKYYLYHLVNNPDEFEYFGSMCANAFEFKMACEDGEVSELYHLYGYCQNGELHDVVSGKTILSKDDLDISYLEYGVPRKWLAYSNTYLVDPIEVADELKELLANNLIDSYIKKQEYVESIPTQKYEEKQKQIRELNEAIDYLENYRNSRK